MSEYQRDQWLSLTAIRGALEQICEAERESLRASLSGYLTFRQELADFHFRHFDEHCQKACYETGLSACCGFESIITLFADQLISCLLSEPADLEVLIQTWSVPIPRENACSSGITVACGGYHRSPVPCFIAIR